MGRPLSDDAAYDAWREEHPEEHAAMVKEIEADDADQAAYHADMLAFEQEAREALIAARTRPLNDAEVAAIAWWAQLDMRRPPARRPPPTRNGEQPF